jgi:hypothetical protein
MVAANEFARLFGHEERNVTVSVAPKKLDGYRQSGKFALVALVHGGDEDVTHQSAGSAIVDGAELLASGFDSRVADQSFGVKPSLRPVRKGSLPRRGAADDRSTRQDEGVDSFGVGARHDGGDRSAKGVPDEKYWFIGDGPQSWLQQLGVVPSPASHLGWRRRAEAREIEGHRSDAALDQGRGRQSEVAGAARPAVQPDHPEGTFAVRLSKNI